MPGRKPAGLARTGPAAPDQPQQGEGRGRFMGLRGHRLAHRPGHRAAGLRTVQHFRADLELYWQRSQLLRSEQQKAPASC